MSNTVALQIPLNLLCICQSRLSFPLGTDNTSLFQQATQINMTPCITFPVQKQVACIGLEFMSHGAGLQATVTAQISLVFWAGTVSVLIQILIFGARTGKALLK